jgi:hypothetical protein
METNVMVEIIQKSLNADIHELLTHGELLNTSRASLN